MYISLWREEEVQEMRGGWKVEREMEDEDDFRWQPIIRFIHLHVATFLAVV